METRSVRIRSISERAILALCRGLVTLMISLVLLIFSHFHIQRTCATEHPDKAVKEIEQEVRKTVTNLLEKLEIYGLNKDEIDKQLKIVSIKNGYPTNKRIAACEMGRINVNVEIENQRVVWLENKNLLYKLVKDVNVHRDSNYSTRTYEQMEELAGELIAKYFGGLPKNVIVDRVKSAVRFGDVWRIRWRRKTGEYMYPQDVILIIISEKHGLLSYHNGVSSCEVDTIINVSEEKAVAIAKGKLELAVSQYNKNEVPTRKMKKIESYDYDSVSIWGGFVDEDAERPSIVNYGLVEPWNSTWPRYSEDMNKTVLIWPVTFSSARNGTFTLYISAKDGSYVGYLYAPPHRRKDNNLHE